MKNIFSMLLSGSLGMALMGLLIFGPAGTFDYWQAWVFLAVIATSSWLVSIYFLRTNSEVLARRRLVPETRITQRVIAGGVFMLWAAMLVVSALDHRNGWSTVPVAVSLFGAALIAIGIGAVGLVLMQNSHAAVTVRVEPGQQLISTGLYGLVRHPMYTCNVFLLVGTPLALGSYWGLVFVIPALVVFAFRIRDEEKLLQEDLAGYEAYMRQVPSRMMPGVW